MRFDHDIWVFGYGSLIWRPDFAHTDLRRARLHGYHRDLCVYSVEHRGTVANPGLVFGMDRGGTCDGVALRVAADEAGEVIRALRVREQVTGVYRERVRPVTLMPDDTHAQSEMVKAICYVVDPLHRQYAGRLTYGQQATLVRAAIGKSGPNVAYVQNTVAALRGLDIRDRHLDRLMTLIGGKIGGEAQGCGPMAERIRQVSLANGVRQGPRWSVRARAELEINHRKNLGY